MSLTPQGQALEDILERAEDGLLWLAREEVSRCTTVLERERSLREAIFPKLATVGEVALEGYVKDLAKIYGVSARSIRVLLKESSSSVSGSPSGAEPPKGGAGNSDSGSNEALAASLTEFNRRHFKTWFGSASYVGREVLDEDGRETVVFVTEGDLCRYYSHVRVPVWSAKDDRYNLKELAKEWSDWSGVRIYERVAFRPQGIVSADTYNLWRGLMIKPARGDCTLYWRHVFEVICRGDDDLYRYVRKWLAHAVQRTEELPEVALVLRGLQGTGKGWFVRPLIDIFGSHALTVHSMEHVSGRFNAHLKDVILLFADEAFWGGDKSREGLIKSLVTERKRLIEPKNKDAQQVDSFTRLIVSTNTDWPLAMDHDDRRMVVLDVSEDHKEEAGYFGALARQMSNGGTAALLHELLSEDLEGWHPRQRPERTTGFDIKLRSSSGVAQWWHECLLTEANQVRGESEVDESERWDECPVVSDLHGSYRRWCERLGRRFIESLNSWSREIYRLVPHCSVYRPANLGADRRRRYHLGPVERCRRSFEAHFRVGAEIWVEAEYQEVI